MNCDYVFPYVNPLDLEWQSLYRMYTGRQDDDYFSSPRFKANDYLRYVFRSIEKFAPWIDNVVLILQSDSQVLPWMNTSTIKIVKHPEFIPIQYIPVFNSTTIEMFLPKIKGLNEFIIYGNDDILFTRSTEFSDFFTPDWKPKLFYTVKTVVTTDFQRSVKNTYNVVRNEDPKFVSENDYIRPSHHLHSLTKELLNEVFDKYKDEMIKHITRFRNNSVNINQYIYSDYGILTNKIEKLEKSNGAYVSCTTGNDLIKVYEAFKNPNILSLCINNIDNRVSDALQDILDKQFPNKSKYEL